MKFKIREGMVVHLRTKVEIADDKFDYQDTSHFAGQVVDLTEDQAREHAHKLEPAPIGKGSVDKEAEAFLASFLPPAATPVGISAEQQALISAVAAETAKAVAAALAGGTAAASATAAPPAP